MSYAIRAEGLVRRFGPTTAPTAETVVEAVQGALAA